MCTVTKPKLTCGPVDREHRPPHTYVDEILVGALDLPDKLSGECIIFFGAPVVHTLARRNTKEKTQGEVNVDLKKRNVRKVRQTTRLELCYCHFPRALELRSTGFDESSRELFKMTDEVNFQIRFEIISSCSQPLYQTAKIENNWPITMSRGCVSITSCLSCQNLSKTIQN